MQSSISRQRYFSNLIIWGIGGLLAWWVGLYLFSFVLYKIPSLVIQYLKEINASKPLINIASIFSFHFGDFIAALLISVVICRITGFGKAWTTAFIFGAIIINIFFQIETFIKFKKEYTELPHWAISAFMQKMIAGIIILPVFTLMGCYVGNIWRTKKAC